MDDNDQLNMNAAGIYMARQGMLFTWTIAEFLEQLTGDRSANLALRRDEQARNETRKIATASIEGKQMSGLLKWEPLRNNAPVARTT